MLLKTSSGPLSKGKKWCRKWLKLKFWANCHFKLWMNKSQAYRASFVSSLVWLMQLYCCQMKKTKDHLLPWCVLLPSQASVGLTLVGSSSSWQHPDTVMWFMAGPESGEQMTTQIRPLAVLSATHQEVRQRSDSLPFTHSAPQAILVSSATAVDFVSRMDFKTRQ